MDFEALFRLDGQVAIVTGGGGVLCSLMAKALAQAGAVVVPTGRTLSKLEAVASEISSEGGQALPLTADVTRRADLEALREQVLARYGRIDVLINGAGGNYPAATTTAGTPFFHLPETAVGHVFDVNFMGTFLACQVFGETMAAQGEGVIINITSMAALKPLTRVPAYAAAKTAVANLTHWLAVHMAQEYAPGIRANAIAPGFFIGKQNRRLLLNEDGTPTPRGQRIIDHTPQGRFGTPPDLAGTTLWLASAASAFVTGIVVPVDGGFSAFGGI